MYYLLVLIESIILCCCHDTPYRLSCHDSLAKEFRASFSNHF